MKNPFPSMAMSVALPVDWMAPAGNEQIVFADCAITPQVPLQISATVYAGIDLANFNRKLDHVDFYRFDVATQKYDLNPITTVNFAGDTEEIASTTLDACSLPSTESDITAQVYDHAGNHSFEFIRVYAATPLWLPLVARQ